MTLHHRLDKQIIFSTKIRVQTEQSLFLKQNLELINNILLFATVLNIQTRSSFKILQFSNESIKFVIKS